MLLTRDDQFFYAKERRKFGRQCLFVDHNELLFDEPPNRECMQEYILKNPSDTGTQLHKEYALSECETVNPEMKPHGMNHLEGGWPKDVNPLDEEQTTRQRKKIMRDDIWGQKMPDLLKTMEKAVLQNGAVNIYEKYFVDLDGIPPREEFSGKTVNIFKDKKEPPRPISSITWSPDGTHVGGSYSEPTYNESAYCDTTSYIWNIENSNVPAAMLTPNSPTMSLHYNSRDQFVLAGGLLSGQVVVWDQRVGGVPIIISEREVAHSDRVNCLLWTTSKTNTEFFSGSSDGTVYFWDTRNMAQPTEQLYLDPVDTNEQVKSRSYGVSVVEFEPTIPTRFMVGSDQGHVFTCNRKGRTPTEIILAKFKTNFGAVHSLERNPAFPKNFLSVGDWAAKIWSDEWRDAPTMWMSNQHVPVLSGTWSRTRCSLFFLTNYDGSFEAWDLLIEQAEPIVRIKLTPSPLMCCAAHENGQLVAVGGKNGFIYLVRVSDNMVASSKVERPAFSLMVDRECRREKGYDSRLREIKLKMRQEQEKEEALEKQEAAGKLAASTDEAQATKTDIKDKLTSDKQKEEEKQKKELEETKRKEEEEKLEKEKKKREEEAKKVATTGESPAKQSVESPATTSGPSADEQASVVPHGGPPAPEFAEEEEVVVDLIELDEKEYYQTLEKEINKRGSYEIIPVLTPFDPGFDITTIMKPEDIEADHKKHIDEIKAKVIKGLLNVKRNKIDIDGVSEEGEEGLE